MNRNGKSIIVLGTIMAFSILAYAETSLKVNVNADNPNHIFFTVDIPQVPLKTLQKNWKDYVGKNSEGQATNETNELVQKGAVNTNISSKPFDVSVKFTQVIEGTNMKFSFVQNNLSFPTKEEDIRTVSKFIHDFAVTVYKKEVSDELAMEKNKLTDMEDRLSTIDKNEDKSLKNIGENERSNVKSEEAIKTNNTDIQSSGDKIAGQKVLVDNTAADNNANRGANKTLDQMESDKKKMSRDNEKQTEKMEKRNADSREEERNIATGNQNRDALKEEIEQQKIVVVNVQNKLDAIN